MSGPAPNSEDVSLDPVRALPMLLLGLVAACAEFDDPVFDDLGAARRCASFETWEGNWSKLEVDMVQALSSARGEGRSCGEVMQPSNTVVVDQSPELRCAAREHAARLAQTDRLAHTNVGGEGIAHRIYDAGYVGIPRGEVLARGEVDPQKVLETWLADPERCTALLDRSLDEVGAGLYDGGPGHKAVWVLTLGSRRR